MNKMIKIIIVLLLVSIAVGCNLVENNITMTQQEKHEYLLQEIEKTKTIELYKKISGEETLIATVTDETEINDILNIISEIPLVDMIDLVGSYFLFRFYDKNNTLLVEFDLRGLWKDSIEVHVPIDPSKLAPFFEALKNEQLFAH